VFKRCCNIPTCVFIILLVFRKVYSLSIVLWTSTHRDYNIARFRLRVSVECIGSVESYIFSRVR
jgi:hypothetical protein